MATELLLNSFLKRLRLPTVLKTYRPLAREAADRNQTFEEYLFCLMEQEVIARDDNNLKQKLKSAKSPTTKTLESFDF